MTKNFHRKRKPLFERLKKGLEEGVRYYRGELSLRTIELPAGRKKAG